MVKTQAELDAEKADYKNKPALEHVPPALEQAAGRAFGYGKVKHGVATPDGWGTWRLHGTSQADPLLHYGCLRRHLALWRSGEEKDPDSGLSHLDHAAAQLAILLDLLARPVVPVSAVVPASMWKPGASEDPGDGKGCP